MAIRACGLRALPVKLDTSQRITAGPRISLGDCHDLDWSLSVQDGMAVRAIQACTAGDHIERIRLWPAALNSDGSVGPVPAYLERGGGLTCSWRPTVSCPAGQVAVKAEAYPWAQTRYAAIGLKCARVRKP